MDRAAHWDSIYGTRPPDQVSWFEADPATSMELIRRSLAAGARSVIDIGGGASSLVDRLLDEPVDRIAVLDVSRVAVSLAEARLAGAAGRVTWVVADVTTIEDVGRFDVWHDRAVFHFLTEPQDRERYLALLARTVPEGGHAIVATFAPDGPDRCSGLPVRRYDAERLAQEVGTAYELVTSIRRTHLTPRGVAQPFVYALLRRSSPPP